MLPNLPTPKRPATNRAVKYFSLAAALMCLSGCATFTEIKVTDLQGEPISSWIAEGRVRKMNGGYAIKAIERTTPPPYPTNTRYPQGRAAMVVGPNITLQEIEKPDWVSEMEVQ